MRNYFIFDSNDSRDYGVYISGAGTFNAPEREYNVVSVAGRNGDLIISNNRYENIDVTYPAWIADSFKTNLENFRSMLLATSGYARLTDTYHTDEFRAAYFSGGIKVDARSRNDAGEFDITFNCKPQRFLTSGETSVSITSGDTITNPTLFDALPTIFVAGYGTLTIGDDVIEISNSFDSIVIDSEIMDCYATSQNPVVNSAIVGTAVLGYSTYQENANGAVSFGTGDFPVLASGDTTITYDNTITAVIVTPRWFRL